MKVMKSIIIDPRTYKELKAFAVYRGVTIGEAIGTLLTRPPARCLGAKSRGNGQDSDPRDADLSPAKDLWRNPNQSCEMLGRPGRSTNKRR